MRRLAALSLCLAAGILLVRSEEPAKSTITEEETAVTPPQAVAPDRNLASPPAGDGAADPGRKPPPTARVETATFALG